MQIKETLQGSRGAGMSHHQYEVQPFNMSSSDPSLLNFSHTAVSQRGWRDQAMSIHPTYASDSLKATLECTCMAFPRRGAVCEDRL